MNPLRTNNEGEVGYSSYHGYWFMNVVKTPLSLDLILKSLVALSAAVKYTGFLVYKYALVSKDMACPWPIAEYQFGNSVTPSITLRFTVIGQLPCSVWWRKNHLAAAMNECAWAECANEMLSMEPCPWRVMLCISVRDNLLFLPFFASEDRSPFLKSVSKFRTILLHPFQCPMPYKISDSAEEINSLLVV